MGSASDMLRAPAWRARAVSGGGGCHLAPLDQSRSPPCAFVAPEDAEGAENVRNREEEMCEAS